MKSAIAWPIQKAAMLVTSMQNMHQYVRIAPNAYARSRHPSPRMRMQDNILIFDFFDDYIIRANAGIICGNYHDTIFAQSPQQLVGDRTYNSPLLQNLGKEYLRLQRAQFNEACAYLDELIEKEPETPWQEQYPE